MSNGSDWGDTNPNWRGGKTFHPLYDVYNDMVGRCVRPTHPAWDRYGGRGITVCDRWRNNFWVFVADVGERPAGTLADGRAAWSLDRIDNDGNYEPGNVRWATPRMQRANRRPQRLKTHCKHNHEFTPENTAMTRDGKRRCRTCAREWARQARGAAA